MHRKLFSTLLLLFCIAFSVSGYAGEYLRGKVVKVSDGDTVWVKLENGNRVKIRIWGIDTPEKFRSKKLHRESERCMVPETGIVRLGKLASRKAGELLNRKRVLIEAHGRGYYGRLLGRVLIEGETDFGLEMIRLGYACAYDRSAPEEYVRAEKRAKKERRGLWRKAYSLMDCLCR